MKVVYFYQYFTTPKGAFSTRVYEFARRWVKAGDSVTVVTTVYDKSDLAPARFISRTTVDGIDVRILNIRISNSDRLAWRILTFLAYAVLATWYALRLPADVVVASSGPITVAVPGLAARWLRGRPLIFEVRDLWPEGAVQLSLLRNRAVIALLRRFEKLCYRSASRVVALSEDAAEWIRNRYGIGQIVVIPNASDTKLVGNLPPKPDLPEWAVGKKLALYAGALGYMYDSRQLLRVASHLEELGADEVELVVIGDGSDRRALEQEARSRQMKHVHFLGQRSRIEMFQWLMASCCAVLIVRNVPFFDMCSPNKVYDALAAGVPVVQDTQGGVKNLLLREECGITVSRGDTEAMARAVLALARDERLRQRMSENGRRVALEQFDRDLLARRMREVLLACVQG